jgi:uncharacterized iron-regulated membrane protein
VNLLLLITTGLLIQHRGFFRLENRYVSRRFLPSAYRREDGPEVRSDIVVTDLHSWRILGTTGALILDAVTVGWSVLLITGVTMYVKRANGLRKAGVGDPPNAEGFEPTDTQSRRQ